LASQRCNRYIRAPTPEGGFPYVTLIIRYRILACLLAVLETAFAKDSESSRHLHAFGARMIGPARFLSPGALLRAAWINVRRPAALTAQPDATV
jgi:hypothetical protein